MKMCAEHWQKLRDAITARGLDGLVAQSGENAHARMVDQLDGGVKKTNFDPLMGANFAIWNNALDVVGLALMTPNEDGSERCPLCYLETNCPCGKGDGCPFRTWVDRAADDMKAEAVKLGLVGGA